MHQELEEAELCEQLNRQHLEGQIAEYQNWEHQSCGEETLVLCPLCKEANLMQLSPCGVACPNNMNGSCALRLERSSETIPLSSLRERLGTAYEMHASSCASPMEFHLENQGDQGDNWTLVATCHTCDTSTFVA